MLTLLGLVLIVCGLINGGWLLLAVWLGADFAVLGVAHGRGSHGVFGKRANGTLPLWSWCLFFPLLIYTIGVWHLIRLFGSESAKNAVTEQLVVGRRLLPLELDRQFENYVDLTAEFAEPAAIRKSSSYHSFPILDGAAPTPDALLDVVSSLRPGRTFIHCAQGHGRTGLFAAAALLKAGAASSAEDALRMLTAVRPGTRLNKEQHRCINAYVKKLRSLSES
jgi:hypothetical protein